MVYSLRFINWLSSAVQIALSPYSGHFCILGYRTINLLSLLAYHTIMAPSFGFVKALLILLAMSSAIATPVAVYEYAPGGVRPSSVLPRQLHPRATPNCAADNILRDLRNP